MVETTDLVLAVAHVGAANPGTPDLTGIDPLEGFLDVDGSLNRDQIDKMDGCCTRREIVLRYLLLSAVLDQGPDVVGVRRLVKEVTSQLYRREVRFLHRPGDFFKEIGISVDEILCQHASVKELRAKQWATANQTNPAKYNLFMDKCKQVLNYAIFRWGVPLAVPLLMDYDEKKEDRKPFVLRTHLQNHVSAERMSQDLKNHERYGLGKAIGDKACHLFAKWSVPKLGLLATTGPEWGPFSFEVPFDSNAGRVLWRTGFFLRWAAEQDYQQARVLQKGGGKGGTTYIRVTNIRGLKAKNDLPQDVRGAYQDLCVHHLRTHKRRPSTVRIQRIAQAFLLAANANVGVAEFDDGLMHIGTKFCFNVAAPDCQNCPIRAVCEGAAGNGKLIENYRT